jgi:hypothetical protein
MILAFGASERTNYYLSGTFKSRSIIGGADAAYKRYTLRTNIKVKLKTG